MNVSLEAEREGDETERNNDIFLYNSETNADGESCNLICLFLLFISFFFVLLITVDNAAINNDYENAKESDNASDQAVTQDRLIDDWLENMLIQGLNFKGQYILHDKIKKNNNITGIRENNKNNNEKKIKQNENNLTENKRNIKKGFFEAKLITLKLAMNNANKAYIFIHFDPPKGHIKMKNKNKKYQFLGISGINVNKNDHYIFSGLGYNISNSCQNYDENCICNYSINIKQNISNYESTSLRELDESYLYSLKNYLLDESEYFKTYIYDQYFQHYKDYLYKMNKFFDDKLSNIDMNDGTVFITLREKDVRPKFIKQYENKGVTNDGYTYDLHEEEYIKIHKLEKKQDTDIASQEAYEEKENKEKKGYQKGEETLINDNTEHKTNEKREKEEKEEIEKEEEMVDNQDSKNNKEKEIRNNEKKEIQKVVEESMIEMEHIKEDEKKIQKDYEGHILSNNCDFYIFLNGSDIDKNEITKRVMNFSVIFNIKSIIELILFWNQIGTSENMHTAAKVSLLSICLNSFIEIFESLLLLYEVMLSRLLLMHFIIMVLLKFLLFTLMEVRYVLIIWKANHQHELSEGWEVMQRKLSKLYKYYYGSILLVILLFYYVFPFYPYILLTLYLCWFPQICLDIWKGQRKSVNLKFVFLLSLCRIFLPVYIFLYPDNIFQLDTFVQLIDTSNITFSILLIIIMFLQLTFMLIQRVYGPRCFFNIDLLPHVHNYYKTVDVNFEAGIPECVICMYDILLKDKKYCVTPCYHIFHEKCLQQWMNVKLECPTCRGVLPNFP